MSVPRPDPSNLLAFPAAPNRTGRRRRSKTRRSHWPGCPADHVSGDALLLGLLALLNESVDMDRALQDSLDMMTSAARGCIGEIWLRTGAARDVSCTTRPLTDRLPSRRSWRPVGLSGLAPVPRRSAGY